MSLQKSFLLVFASIMVLMLISILLVFQVIENEQKISEAEAKRYKSYLLADELRQSSDDLTRMARTYSVTGDLQYKEYFDRILEIRNGEAPRPLKYHSIYWDFVVATGSPPRVDTTAQALKALMKEAEFTETEFALLRETENESNDLVNLENRAMNAMLGIFEDGSGHYVKGEPDRELARTLLYSKEYHHAKEKIMKPLEKFFDAVDRRTAGEIAFYTDKQRRLELVLMITLGLSALLVFISLVLGILSLQKKEMGTGRSHLAQRLAASGYPSSSSAKKETARERMAKRIGAGGPSSSPSATATQDTSEQKGSYLVYLFQNFKNDWPLITAAVVVTFMTLGLSWWFLSENRMLSYAEVRDDLKSNLDATHSAILDWLDRTNMDANIFSESISRRLSHGILSEIKNNPTHGLHRELEGLSIAESQIFENYLLTDLSGVVFSSNRTELIGKYFAFPEEYHGTNTDPAPLQGYLFPQ